MGEGLKIKKNYFWAVAGMALTSPLFFFFEQQGKPGTGRAAWICAGIFFVVPRMRWRLRNRPWFWVTFVCLLALHVPLILYVPWTSRWIPAIGILPIGVLDLVAILGCVGLVEKQMKVTEHSDEQS